MEREPETFVLGVGDSERCRKGLRETDGNQRRVETRSTREGCGSALPLVVWLVWTRLLSVISISESDKELRDDKSLRPVHGPGWTAGITVHCQWFRTVG
jgi:hypothetical protein